MHKQELIETLVNNILKILLIFIFISSCSFHENSKFWTNTEKVEELKKEKFVLKKVKQKCKIKLIKYGCEELEQPNKKVIYEKEKSFSEEFNPNLKISLYTKPIDKSFYNNYDNNNGRINYNGKLKNI